MDAFEQIVADLLRAEGWWVSTNVKVKLDEEERLALGMKNAPPFEFDIVAYRGKDNRFLLLECKSYMFSDGVKAGEVKGESGKYQKRYRLFNNPLLQQTVTTRLMAQCVADELCRDNPTFQLGLVCGKLSSERSRKTLKEHFAKNDWLFWDEHDLRRKLEARAMAYVNATSVLVARLLKRK